ncbi:MAG: hypothetical protein GY934_20260 [Gammaproteobacteria bacterium]|nr:hypothetical protein [Gammaproteobacteria bacterium]
MKQTDVICGRVPMEVADQIRALAKEREVSLTTLMKEMVTDYLARKSPQTKDHSVPEIPDFM